MRKKHFFTLAAWSFALLLLLSSNMVSAQIAVDDLSTLRKPALVTIRGGYVVFTGFNASVDVRVYRKLYILADIHTRRRLSDGGEGGGLSTIWGINNEGIFFRPGLRLATKNGLSLLLQGERGRISGEFYIDPSSFSSDYKETNKTWGGTFGYIYEGRLLYIFQSVGLRSNNIKLEETNWHYPQLNKTTYSSHASFILYMGFGVRFDFN